MRNRELNQLVKRLKNKDNKAFEELYQELWSIIYYFACKYLGNSENAKDITQEAFVIIYQKIDELKNDEAFNSWMNRIVVNLCNRHQNLDARKAYIDFNDMAEEPIEDNIEFLPEEILHNKNEKNLLFEEIDKLPPELRSTLLLYYFEEMTIVEIAEVLGIGKSAVHKRLKITRNILRSKFEKSTIYNSTATGLIVSIILQQNKDIVCTEGIKNQIYHNINNSLKLNTINASKGLTLVKPFIITSILFISLFAGYILFNQSKENSSGKEKKEVITNKEENKEVTLETFVGNENAGLIIDWKTKKYLGNNDQLTRIISDCQLSTLYSYIDPETGVMYVLYSKDVDNKALLLSEIFNSEKEEWNVVYEIVDSNTKTIDKSMIKDWVENLENN